MNRTVSALTRQVVSLQTENRVLVGPNNNQKVDASQDVFIRTEPPASATKVVHELRTRFPQKMKEQQVRTAEQQRLIDGRTSRILRLQLKRREAAKEKAELKRLAKQRNKELVNLQKLVDDADVSAELDLAHDSFAADCN